MSVTSVANDKGDNEMISETVHRSPGICLTAEENTGKPQLGDRLMKGLCHVIASYGDPYLQMKLVGSHRKEEGRKEGKDGEGIVLMDKVNKKANGIVRVY